MSPIARWQTDAFGDALDDVVDEIGQAAFTEQEDAIKLAAMAGVLRAAERQQGAVSAIEEALSRLRDGQSFEAANVLERALSDTGPSTTNRGQ